MKSKLYVFIALLLVGQAAMAQFTLGVKGGANINKIEGRSFKEEFNYGYHLGGFMEIGLGGRLGLHPEVLFNQYQTKTDTSLSNVFRFRNTNRDEIKLNYLSIPILLDYKLGNVLSLQAGPQFGVLMNKDNTVLENGEQAFKTGDLSLLGGVRLKVSKFRVTGRYMIGLNEIQDFDNQEKWKNQGFQLSVGLAL